MGKLEKLKHNDFWEGDYAYVYGPVAPRVYYSLGDLTNLESDLGDKAANNVAFNPEFDPVGDGWHLSASTPIEVYEGGDNVQDLPGVDKDGITRTIPWSIGAYEWD